MGHLVMSLLDTPEVQRLRGLKQLGLAQVVFPGAEHSRFVHALGTTHLMCRLMDKLSKGHVFGETARLDAVAAALLHDLGHGPLSHLFEEVSGMARSHESWTVALIQDPATKVNGVLEEFDAGMSERVCRLIQGTSTDQLLQPWVSGVLDVDRCDYLLRDSHMTGVRYGAYDLQWLLRVVDLVDVPGLGTVVGVKGQKAVPPLESYFLGRHYMYRQVYHHRATRAAESLVKGLFERLHDVGEKSGLPEFTPRAIALALSGRVVPSEAYLALDDATLAVFFSRLEDSGDPVLAGLSTALRGRKLPKTILLEIPLDARAMEDVRELASGAGYAAKYWLREDVTCDVPYAESDGLDGTGVWVQSEGRCRRLGEVSFVLGQLKNQRVETRRLIFPQDLRGRIEPLITRFTSNGLGSS